MNRIEAMAGGWMLRSGDLVLTIDRKTGCLSSLKITRGKGFDWTVHAGAVTVRDDRLRRTFDNRDLQSVRGGLRNGVLSIQKSFKGAPWRLHETYRLDSGDAIHWEACVQLDAGAFRSCAVSYRIPWPQPLYPVSFWAAREQMPSAPHRFAGISLEYGEITSGITIPALCSYLEAQDVGLLLAMPFDFKTPRLRFLSGYREPDLQAEFDWMALAPGKPARTSLLIRATGGTWRPALGWLCERFKEYFEPRSTLADTLWGGHAMGGLVSAADARTMARLGLRWYELHHHFPTYGNYHPEGTTEWMSRLEPGDKEPTVISAERIRESLRTIHRVGAKAFPYIQVTGDACDEVAAKFESSVIRDLHGETMSAWSGTKLMNSDPSLPFGRDVSRQIDGMAKRYPEMDGVFLDQPCYNFLDSAHHDGITAVDNRPCYMTGFNYFPHLERLSALLHPGKAIMGNAPFGVGILKYIDGFMAESVGWLCDHLQYYGLCKPLYHLVYDYADRLIESMLQRCLVHGVGYTSAPQAAASRDLYRLYGPLLDRLARRRWVFDPAPIKLPSGFDGSVFRGPSGNLLASAVNQQSRARGRSLVDGSVMVSTADIANVRKVTLQTPGGRIVTVPFVRENGGVRFDIPGNTVAAVAELHMRNGKD